MSRVAIARINLQALRHNLSVVRNKAPESKVLAVIKANAYGHGLLEVAESLIAADAFAVAHFEEAISLRERFPDKTIVLLQGFSDEIELTLLLSQHIQPVIHCLSQIDLLEAFVEQNPDEILSVWLKVDTGMHRLGVSIDNFEDSWARLNTISGLHGNIKIMSHFANADIPEFEFNQVQSQLFHKVTSTLECEKSLANSAGLLSHEEYHYHWVRPGIMLYGVSPFNSISNKNNVSGFNLLPVMHLSSRIIAINKIKKGQVVGYGSCWQAPEDSVIAVVGIGYGDGYPRHIKESTPVLIDGQRYPIVGRVSMDMICVDLGNSTRCQMGDEVLLWGEGLPVEEIAEHASTIAYELLCQITARVKYVYENNTPITA